MSMNSLRPYRVRQLKDGISGISMGFGAWAGGERGPRVKYGILSTRIQLSVQAGLFSFVS